MEEIPVEIETIVEEKKKEKSHRDRKHRKKRDREIREEIKEEIAIEESLQNHFNSPYVAPDHSSQITSTCDFSLSQSSMNQSFKLSKQHYNQGFKDLKSSLLDVKSFFENTSPSDPEYSMSLEESSQDIQEIQDLLRSISASLGSSLPVPLESTFLEKYSEKLVTMFEKKLKSRVPEY